MRAGRWAGYVAGAAIVFMSAASTAHAQVVTFSDVNDAVPSRFFNAATSAPDSLDANTLVIGFDTGIDWSTWKYRDFRASTAAFSHPTAMDTISFRIQAPEGFYISSITFTQRGTGSVLRLARAAGGTSWVVGDLAENLGIFGASPVLTRTLDLTNEKLTFVPVSITTTLFAYAAPSLGSASVSVTGASVKVELLPLTYEP